MSKNLLSSGFDGGRRNNVKTMDPGEERREKIKKERQK